MILSRLRRKLQRRPQSAARPSTASLRAILFDWRNTLMKDLPGQDGPMAHWPRVRSMPGVHAALNKLPGHLTCCVVTGAEDSDADLLAAALARVRIRHHFRHFLTPRELGHEKPSPEFYRAVADHLSIRPESIAVVADDLLRDIVPAKSVGMRTIWVTPLKVVTLPSDADVVIRNMKELSRALSRISR